MPPLRFVVVFDKGILTAKDRHFESLMLFYEKITLGLGLDSIQRRVGLLFGISIKQTKGPFLWFMRRH